MFSVVRREQLTSTCLCVETSFNMGDGGLQCISMQHVKDLLEDNYAYLSGV